MKVVRFLVAAVLFIPERAWDLFNSSPPVPSSGSSLPSGLSSSEVPHARYARAPEVISTAEASARRTSIFRGGPVFGVNRFTFRAACKGFRLVSGHPSAQVAFVCL